jgi:hypothetical protein
MKNRNRLMLATSLASSVLLAVCLLFRSPVAVSQAHWIPGIVSSRRSFK